MSMYKTDIDMCFSDILRVRGIAEKLRRAAQNFAPPAGIVS